MSISADSAEGDNIEFTAVTIGDYTIWLIKTGTDSEFIKYSTNPRAAGSLSIRVDKNSDLLTEDNVTFTNPITMVADKEHRETRSVPFLAKIIIRTNATNTKIKVRWF